MIPFPLLEAFIHSVNEGSFSAAARRLELSPAAVSKNVATLEASLGVRLFHRSTRRLTLTEAGERIHGQIGAPLENLQEALASVVSDSGQPSGTLKISVGQAFGRAHVVPLLCEFLAKYPAVLPDFHFDNRQVDLIGEGFDAAIGGGFELNPSMVARELTRIHIVATASPRYMEGRPRVKQPADLAQLDGIVRRSSPTGRVRDWSLRNAKGREEHVGCVPKLIFSDPEAMAEAVVMGLGVALLPMPFAERWLKTGELVRLLPGWYADAGPVSIYYPSKKLLPAKTRAFVDFILERFKSSGFAARMDGR
ncbi:LysR family transcriptional regulator [soil metagenome]